MQRGSLLRSKMSEDVVSRVGIDLQTAYEEKLLPLERRHDFHEFHPTPPPDFTSKPLVVVVGAAGAGKTTLVSWLLGRKALPAGAGGGYSTTAFVYGPGEALLPGPTALASPYGKAFASLKKLGNAFLSRFQMVVCAAEPLRWLSVAECRSGSPALGALCAAADALLLLVEAGRAADLPPQLPPLLAARPHAARLLLSKADALPYHHLLRVYGALLWTLAQAVPAADPPRLLVMSLRGGRQPQWVRALYRRDAAELLAELRQAPRLACAQRLSALAQRAALAQLHAALAAAVARRLGGSRRVTSALLAEESERLRREQRSLVSGREDLVATAAGALRARLLRWDRQAYDAARLRSLKPHLLRAADALLTHDVPAAASLLLLRPGDGIVRGGAFEALQAAGAGGDKDGFTVSHSSGVVSDHTQKTRRPAPYATGDYEEKEEGQGDADEADQVVYAADVTQCTRRGVQSAATLLPAAVEGHPPVASKSLTL